MTTDSRFPSSHLKDVEALLALDPDDRPQWFRDLTDELTGDTPAALGDPAETRRLLTLPADQRPDWLNEFLGNMTVPPIPDTSTNPLPDVVTANTAYGQKNAALVFPLAKVLAAAEHAAAADQHKLGYGETEAAPRLWWVKDDGTYLMSTARTLPTPPMTTAAFPTSSTPTAGGQAPTPAPSSAVTTSANPST